LHHPSLIIVMKTRRTMMSNQPEPRPDDKPENDTPVSPLNVKKKDRRQKPGSVR
jgi:hypothetical protein